MMHLLTRVIEADALVSRMFRPNRKSCLCKITVESTVKHPPPCLGQNNTKKKVKRTVLSCSISFQIYQ